MDSEWIVNVGLWGSRLVLGTLAGTFLVASILGTELSLRVQAWLYLGLMIGIGLPHGGYEHAVNLQGRVKSFQLGYLAAYLGLLAVAILTFLIAPIAGFLLAVSVTVLKAGYGGLQVLQEIRPESYLRSRWRQALGTVVRGGSLMLLGLAFHPGDFALIAERMVTAFGGELAAMAPVFSESVLSAIGIGWWLLTGGYLAAGRIRGEPIGAWSLDAFEVLLLGTYFVIVPPIIAVGVYFPCWYASRQIARMVATGDGRDRKFDLRRTAITCLKKAAVPWLGAVALLAWVTIEVGPPATVFGWVGIYSAVIAAIALPHVVVGSWLDHRRGIWSSSN